LVKVLYQVLDYWLNRVFFDLQAPAAQAAYRADRAAFLARYPLADGARAALLADDFVALAQRGCNPYLIRLYALILKVPDAQFIAALRAAAGSR
jgi:protocatechuate 4,5-dioxygenase alpha chain